MLRRGRAREKKIRQRPGRFACCTHAPKLRIIIILSTSVGMCGAGNNTSAGFVGCRNLMCGHVPDAAVPPVERFLLRKGRLSYAPRQALGTHRRVHCRKRRVLGVTTLVLAVFTTGLLLFAWPACATIGSNGDSTDGEQQQQQEEQQGVIRRNTAAEGSIKMKAGTKEG